MLRNPTSEEQCVVNVTVDGWITIRSNAAYAHYMTLEVNSHTVWFGYAPSTLPAGDYFYTPMIPVKAGDIFTFKTNYNYGLDVMFFPAIFTIYRLVRTKVNQGNRSQLSKLQ